MPAGEDDTIAGSLPQATGGITDVAEHVAGRYRIVRWLGGGGMGRVYEALDTELNERVALKVLRANLSDEGLERFRREVRLTRRVQHRNVARMFDIGDHGADKFLTMELIDGEPLTATLGQQMPWARLHALAVQLCDGLAAAHQAGVIHRDLKPDNILIERGTDRAVITDFGIARGADDASVTQEGSVIGTPRYMAPEQLHATEVDARADLFSLGVILFELASGTRPWAGNNVIEMAVAQATQPARPLSAPHVPRRFVELVGSCVALERSRRPASAAEVATTLAELGAAAIESAPPRHTIPPAFAATPTPIPTVPFETTTLAVLQFSAPPGDEYLADALREDLTDSLSTASLRVRPAGGAIHRETDPREIGRALDVDHVVAGSIRCTPAGLRVAARLICVADGFQIWAHRVDCASCDLLATAEQLGHEVARALSCRARPAARPTDPRAVELYLRARAELRRFWGSHAETAADLLEEAARLSPDSPAILSALAIATAQAWVRRGRRDLLPRAREAVARALASGHAEAYLGSALVRMSLGDPEGGASDLGRALARAQMSAPTHETVGRLLVEIGDPAEARHHFAIAVGLDPGRAVILANDLARMDALAGDMEGARRRAEAVAADPDPAVAQVGAMTLARLANWRRDLEEAMAPVRAVKERLGPGASLLFDFAVAWIADRSFDAGAWARMLATTADPDQPYRSRLIWLQRATEVALLIEQHEAAIDAARCATELGLVDIAWFDHCPLLAGLRTDPRGAALRAQIAGRAERVLAAFRAASA